MRNLVFLILGSLIAVLTLNRYKSRDEGPTLADNASVKTSKKAICIVFYQDVSGSISKNGVEIVSSEIFSPYYTEVDRNIDLHFGIIDSLTAGRLITLSLPAKSFEAPILQDLRKLSITEKRREKERFLSADRIYKTDSIQFYEDRDRKIKEFSSRVELALAQFKNQLSSQTDLSTAIDIADKVFNYSQFPNAKNYLLLNSDGFDSVNKDSPRLQNEAEVILINAGKKERSSVDPIVTKLLESSEQAIQYTLYNY